MTKISYLTAATIVLTVAGAALAQSAPSNASLPLQTITTSTTSRLPLQDAHDDRCAERKAMIDYACGRLDPFACVGAHTASMLAGCGWQ